MEYTYNILKETIWNGNGLKDKKCMNSFVVQKEMREDEMALHLTC